MAAPASKDDTQVLPAVREILGDSPIYQRVKDENAVPVRSLNEAGLTRVVFVSSDRKGKFHVKVSVVSFDTRDAIVGLLGDEHVA